MKRCDVDGVAPLTQAQDLPDPQPSCRETQLVTGFTGAAEHGISASMAPRRTRERGRIAMGPASATAVGYAEGRPGDPRSGPCVRPDRERRAGDCRFAVLPALTAPSPARLDVPVVPGRHT